MSNKMNLLQFILTVGASSAVTLGALSFGGALKASPVDAPASAVEATDFATQFAEARPGCRSAADFAASVGAYVDEQGRNATVSAVMTAFDANPGYAERTYPGVDFQFLGVIAKETIEKQIGEGDARRFWLAACMKENGIKQHS